MTLRPKRLRQALIVAGLVVLPTAILSLLASHALRTQEAVMMHGMRLKASSAVAAVSSAIRSRLEADLTDACVTLSECLERRGRYGEVKAAADRLIRSRGTMRQVYLFMNPWGLLYPQESGAAGQLRPGWDFMPAGSGRSADDPVLAALRREIASAPAARVIGFKSGESVYFFAPLRGQTVLYGGYEVDGPKLEAELDAALEAYSGAGFVLRRQAGADRAADGVFTSDSFSGERPARGREGAAPGRADDESSLLAAGRLAFPLNGAPIFAYSERPGEIARMGRLHMRLSLWGIALLACGICLGVWMALRDSALELRRIRERTDFIVGVSHDLRTPLASMKMLAESLYLEHVGDAAKRRKFCGLIVRECERLRQLIERVLFLVRLEQDALLMGMKALNPGDVVRAAVRTFDAQVAPREPGAAEGEGGRCAVRVEKGAPQANVDETALSQAILNLLDNAVKYSGGSGPIEVGVETALRRRRIWDARRRWVRISVRDHGIGIARRHLKRIFSPFYRVPGSAGRNVSGVGLGLALCRHVARSHGGWMEVESEEGQGSVFSIFLPEAK